MTPAAFAKIALSLDGAVEGAHGGHADFRAGGKVFATLGYPDKDWGMVKLAPEQQQMLVAAEPGMFVPVKGTWGLRGATSVRLAEADARTLRSALPWPGGTCPRGTLAPKKVVKMCRRIIVRRHGGWPWLFSIMTCRRKVRGHGPARHREKPRRP